MKKLMIVLAAVAVAAVAQAASIDWSISNSAWKLSDDSNAASGTTVYLINGKTSLDVIAAAVADSTVSTSLDWVYGSAATDNTRGRVSLTTTTSDSLTRGTDYDFSILVIDTTVADDPKYMVSKTSTQTAYLNGTDEALGVTFAASSFGANALTGGWTSASVPEPTSGLLMLLGMAGLALRRRRA